MISFTAVSLLSFSVFKLIQHFIRSNKVREHRALNACTRFFEAFKLAQLSTPTERAGWKSPNFFLFVCQQPTAFAQHFSHFLFGSTFIHVAQRLSFLSLWSQHKREWKLSHFVLLYSENAIKLKQVLYLFFHPFYLCIIFLSLFFSSIKKAFFNIKQLKSGTRPLSPFSKSIFLNENLRKKC